MNNSRQQLIDSLTSHISLYHSKSSPNPNPNCNPRSSILKWFSSLTIHQRQAYLTIVDSNFAQILLQMLKKLKSTGHGFFIVLPDIPSGDASLAGSSKLPSLCFRKSHGLSNRVSQSNESEQFVRESVRLFCSKEGETVGNSMGLIDTVTVCEDFVEDVDRIVGAMDSVSNGGFLMGEEKELGAQWVEMEWLKTKGYYSVEAFVANRLEEALRLAWLSCNNARRRGVKLKDKVNAVGIAANVFWRKKRCVDWWDKLDESIRRKVLLTAIGKAAKILTADILKGTGNGWKDEMSFCSYEEASVRRNSNILSGRNILNPMTSGSGMSSSLISLFNCLLILQDISIMMSTCQHGDSDKDKLFFSTFNSLSTISDCISRKLRGLIMLVSLNCTKLELLEAETLTSPAKKDEEKHSASKRKKKGKNRKVKRPSPLSKSSEDDPMLTGPAKVNGYGYACQEIVDVDQSTRLADNVQKQDIVKSSLPTVNMGHSTANSAVRPPKKSKRGKNKHRNVSSKFSTEAGNCQTEIKLSFVPAKSKVAANSDDISDCSAVENVPGNTIGNGELDGYNPGSAGGGHSGSKQHQTSDGGRDNSNVETVKCERDPCATTIVHMDKSNESEREDMRSRSSSQYPQKRDSKPSFLGDKANDGDAETTEVASQEKRIVHMHASRTTSSSASHSYEWPSIAPIQFSYLDSRLPAATDRLHLDVGHNWQNHFHQSFVQTVHQVRNPLVESGRPGILSRAVPMSLDWPPMVRAFNRLAPSLTCNYDTGFIARPSFQPDFLAQGISCSSVVTEDERVYSGNFTDFTDLSNSQEHLDEHDSHWMSEEEPDVHAVSGMDYNQYFGGGVMYWNPSDFPGNSFSRPPSLSSDDSSWAWREADMNRAVDDMVAFSSSYSTTGLTSPSAASYCSPFDPLGSHQALGYVVPGNEVTGKVPHSPLVMTDGVADENGSGSMSNLSGDVETKTGDSLPYPILRPIIIPNMSRERSRSDFKRNHDHKSPCVPPNRREHPRVKRPPSPVVLCVPRAPRPPPPSPVGDSRRHRGFPTVRSGSSSPRHWGVKGWFHDGISLEETCIRMDGSEVFWPSWRNKSFSAHQLTQPLPGALLQDRLIAISQLSRDQEHSDVAFPLQPPELQNCSTRKESLSLIHSLLHNEIDAFCKQVAAENLILKPYVNWAVKRVTRSLQVLWPRSRTNVFGSNATGLSLPSSDVDLVVCLPPVRNLEPIKEAGILEGRNGIKETCLQHAARYLANQEWVKSDSLKIVENTAIPIIMLVAEVPHDPMTSSALNVQTPKDEPDEQNNPFKKDASCMEASASPRLPMLNSDNGKDVKSVRLDISFKSPTHTGLQTTQLVKDLTDQFPAATPLALVLKQFLADRSLDQSYSGGLSSYCLVLLITRFLQHEHHHGRPINENYGSLLMDFLYFFGNVFDPRQMRISIQGSGLYVTRERGCSIDPIYIDDPLFPTNNVGRNCFRIHQCIKAFADAYSILENELGCLPGKSDSDTRAQCKLLPKIIPSMGHLKGP